MNYPTARFSRGIAWTCFGSLLLGASATLAQEVEAPAQTTEPLSVTSPDGAIEVTIHAAGSLTYSVSVDGRAIIDSARLGLKLREGTVFGTDVELLSSAQQSEDSTWENRLGKRRLVRNQYRELSLLLREVSANDRTVQVIFRVYDDGVAFRYVLLSQPGLRDFVLEQELTEFRFPEDYFCFAGDHENKFQCSQEWEFRRRRLSDFTTESVIGLPVLVETPHCWTAIAEADLRDWAGMWIAGANPPDAPDSPETGESDAGPSSKSATSNEREPATRVDDTSGPVTLSVKLAPRPDGEGLVRGKTPHHSSWRVLMIGRQPGRLIESEIIRNLSRPSELADTSWIQPGLMAWDHWWSGDTIMDTATIKEYIQFAADMGWHYQLIDWQWYGEPNKPDADITTVVDSLDMDEVRRFAAERGVRLWLWLHWTDVDRNDAYKKAFPLYEQWGVAGVKIDFMDRDDQETVNWYEKITAAAAEHQLMVNFHGAFKTSGFDRTYPNQVTREGILGNEYNKWSNRVTPEHKLTLPFTRFLEGPADFTPGGFLNRQPDQFQPNTKPTPVQGTRAAELALFVCYDSPVCCVCDHPGHILNQPGEDFLRIVPTVWDDTRVIDGAVGEYLAMVRRSDNRWFLGAMTSREPREIDVKLNFLDAGRWSLILWQDAADSNRNAEHLEVEKRTVSPSDTLHLKLAPSGGCVGVLEKQ